MVWEKKQLKKTIKKTIQKTIKKTIKKVEILTFVQYAENKQIKSSSAEKSSALNKVLLFLVWVGELGTLCQRWKKK